MKRYLQIIGRLVTWLCWPILWKFLRGSQRSRLLLVHDQEVLVIHNWLGDGRWDLPGGGQHATEFPEGALRRELLEELQIVLPNQIIQLLASEPLRTKGLTFTVHYFVATVPERYTTRPRRLEIAEAQWLPIQELTPEQASPAVLRALELFQENKQNG